MILTGSDPLPAHGWAGQGRLFPPPARKKFFGEAQARAGREGKRVWGKRPEGVAEGDPTG